MLIDWDADESAICTRDRADNNRYRYVKGGKSDEAPGCGRCWCCVQPIQERNAQSVSMLFRPGFNRYQGLLLKELRSGGVSANDLLNMTIDKGDAGHVTQVLLRFDGIIGMGPSQIRPNATVTSALLNLNIVNAGGGIEVHQMLVPWDASSSWASLGGDGVSLGREAAARPVVSASSIDIGLLSLEIKDAVQAWARGQPNYGLALTAMNSDGVDFTTDRTQTPPTLNVKVLQEVSTTTVTTTTKSSTSTITTKPPTTTTQATTTTAAPTLPPTQPPTTTRATTSTVPALQTTVSLPAAAAATTPASTAPPTAAPPSASTTPPSQAVTGGRGMRAEFYYGVGSGNTGFEAAVRGRKPDLVRTDKNVDYASGSPSWNGVHTAGSFAARWTAQLVVRAAGRYRFEVQSDDLVQLTIDGEVLLGGQADSPGLAPVFMPKSPARYKELSAGGHALVLTLLQLEDGGLVAVDCKYEGPDTEGELVLIPEDVLRLPAGSPAAPAPPRTVTPGAVAAAALREFSFTDATGETAAAAATAPAPAGGWRGLGAAVAFLGLALALPLAPGAVAAAVPHLRAWRGRLQQRSLRRYGSLAAAVRGLTPALEHT